MIKLGRINRIKIISIDDKYVTVGEGRHSFAIDKFRIPGAKNIGDEIEGFVYSDRKGKFYFTPQKPNALLGEFANLKVLEVTQKGAFVDWGIEKDLFVPVEEVAEPLEKGKFYTFFIKMDKRLKQIVGTTNIKEYLIEPDDRIKENDRVDFLVTNLHRLGYRIIINNKYQGLIFADAVIGNLKPGDKSKGVVKKIGDDGKIDVSLFRGPSGFVKHGETIILDLLHKSGGYLPLHDRTLPIVIEEKTGMSKKLFKKAIGSLYNKKKILIEENGISLAKSNKP